MLQLHLILAILGDVTRCPWSMCPWNCGISISCIFVPRRCVPEWSLLTRGGSYSRKIRLIEGNAKCRHLKKYICKGTLRQMLILLRHPPLQWFCLRWPSNFVGSESGQIQSVKIPQNMVSNRTPIPQRPYALYTYIQYTVRSAHKLRARRTVSKSVFFQTT